jgi:uncharacterized membrane protein YqiK
MGEKVDTIFNLPGKYNEFSDGLKLLLQNDLSKFGLALTELYINSITPPPEYPGWMFDRQGETRRKQILEGQRSRGDSG